MSKALLRISLFHSDGIHRYEPAEIDSDRSWAEQEQEIREFAFDLIEATELNYYDTLVTFPFDRELAIFDVILNLEGTHKFHSEMAYQISDFIRKLLSKL